MNKTSPTQIFPSRQDFDKVDAVFFHTARSIMRHFHDMTMFDWLHALDDAMRPSLPADQLARIRAVRDEIASVLTKVRG